ncbi:hypothetical protein NPX13_g1686 [Xylaria arbuscula]|uniref:Uncharacterized protein n=1 Tax=Xylaria arbuscula TaxID=114810 RepID=A0A9W8TR22_9PEZI|nr:hypothetical protein NPX13_g1686 [Xylaria arbuscula]
MGCGPPYPPPSSLLYQWDVANANPNNNYSGNDYFKTGLIIFILALFFLPRNLNLNPIRRIAQLRRQTEESHDLPEDADEFADWDRHLAGENRDTDDPDAIRSEEMRALRAGFVGKMKATTTSKNGASARRRAR